VITPGLYSGFPQQVVGAVGAKHIPSISNRKEKCLCRGQNAPLSVKKGFSLVQRYIMVLTDKRNIWKKAPQMFVGFKEIFIK